MKTIDDLGGYAIPDEQLGLYTRLGNQKRYEDYVSQQKQNYKNMTQSSPLGWLAMGIKGEGWNENDYLKNRGIDEEAAKLGASGQLGYSDMGNLVDYGRSYDKKLGQDLEGGKNLYSGIPLLGEILNPWGQLASAGQDLATSGLTKWQNGKRDAISDVGALGEAAFDVAGMGALGNAVKGGTKLMSNVGKTALRTGVLGAGENAFAALRERGKDATMGDLAISAGIGGAFGGGLGALSQLGGNAANIAKQVRSPQMRTLNEYYQDALAGNSAPLNPTRMLGDGVGGASVGTAGNYLDWVPKEAKAAMERSGTPLAKTGIGRVFQGFGDSKAIYGSPLAPIMNSKVGQTTRNILKTPAGKIGAGVGGGLLVASLLRGGGNNQAQADLSSLSDEQLLQLLNYYNNGGY